MPTLPAWTTQLPPHWGRRGGLGFRPYPWALSGTIKRAGHGLCTERGRTNFKKTSHLLGSAEDRLENNQNVDINYPGSRVAALRGAALGIRGKKSRTCVRHNCRAFGTRE